MKYSIAIPNYSRTDHVHRLVSHNINNPYVSEIVVTQEFLGGDKYIPNRVKELTDIHEKVNFYQNEIRLGAFLNKLKAVKMCKNDWIALCDSDNFMDESYFEVLNQHELDEDVLYCPSWARTKYYGTNTLDFRGFSGRKFIGIESLKEETGYFFHTGNFLFNRKKYIEVANIALENIFEEYHNNIGFDSFYFNYHWLKEGKTIYCVPELEYEHNDQQDATSAWTKSQDQIFWKNFVQDKTNKLRI